LNVIEKKIETKKKRGGSQTLEGSVEGGANLGSKKLSVEKKKFWVVTKNMESAGQHQQSRKKRGGDRLPKVASGITLDHAMRFEVNATSHLQKPSVFREGGGRITAKKNLNVSRDSKPSPAGVNGQSTTVLSM